MKKVITILLAAAMMAALPATAFAAETTIDQNTQRDPKTGSTAVTFTVDPTYTVTIPSTIKLEPTVNSVGEVTYENEFDITAKNVRLLATDRISVKMFSNSGFDMLNVEFSGYKVNYTVSAESDGDGFASGEEVASFTTDKETQSQKLYVKADDPDFAGEYSDTVTFELSVVKN